MADIRIKDLTTTASTTAADDFFAADGATNGTRKLSAYSPSFGGNATVGGTLTVSGTSSLLTVANSTGSALLAAFSSAYASGSATPYVVIGSFSDPATSGARIAVSTDYSLDNRAAIQLQTRTTAGTLQTALTLANTRNATFAADVAISGTTASTTTSSGALVVGNGTSGGLGVGGAANIGGTLTVSGTGGIGASASGDVGFKVLSSLTSGSFQYGIYSYPTVNAGTADGGLFGVRAGTSVAVTTAFALRAFTPTLDSGASIASNIGIRVENQGATGITNAFGIDILAQSGASTTNVGLRNAGTTLLTNTTASNNTSSGALVVSGGVGVAGAIYAGGDVFVVKADPSSTLTRTANTNSALFQLTTGATYDFAFGLRNTTDSDFHLYNYGTSSDALTIARASSNATFAGTVIANASSNAFRITTAQTPASAAATGTAGTIAWDTSYIYVCTATNTWKRVAIATW